MADDKRRPWWVIGVWVVWVVSLTVLIGVSIVPDGWLVSSPLPPATTDNAVTIETCTVFLYAPACGDGPCKDAAVTRLAPAAWSAWSPDQCQRTFLLQSHWLDVESRGHKLLVSVKDSRAVLVRHRQPRRQPWEQGKAGHTYSLAHNSCGIGSKG